MNVTISDIFKLKKKDFNYLIKQKFHIYYMTFKKQNIKNEKIIKIIYKTSNANY